MAKPTKAKPKPKPKASKRQPSEDFNQAAFRAIQETSAEAKVKAQPQQTI
jgi:hypothetical protein